MRHPMLYKDLITGLLISIIVTMLAAVNLPFDPSHWHPIVLWLAKAIGGVIFTETVRRFYRLGYLDKYFPDRKSLRARWRQRKSPKDRPLGLDE